MDEWKEDLYVIVIMEWVHNKEPERSRVTDWLILWLAFVVIVTMVIAVVVVLTGM